jgi:hypothetical protein
MLRGVKKTVTLHCEAGDKLLRQLLFHEKSFELLPVIATLGLTDAVEAFLTISVLGVVVATSWGPKLSSPGSTMTGALFCTCPEQGAYILPSATTHSQMLLFTFLIGISRALT